VLDVVLSKRRVIKVYENGNYETVDHRPWFLATRVPEGVEDYEELKDVRIYAFDPKTMGFEPLKPVFRIYADHPARVPRLADEVVAMGGRVSMANIRYKARVSMDLADSVFGVKVPLPLHYRVGELEALLREVYEGSQKLKVLAFDIEVAPSRTGSFPRPGDRVFLVSYVETTIGDDGAEPVVLEGDQVYDFIKVLEKTSANYIVGFVSKNFDIPYLTGYITELEGKLGSEGFISTRVIPHIDLAEIIAAHGSSFGLPTSARMALDAVAESLGVASKEELEIESSVDRTKIFEEYQRNREKVVKYSAIDATLTARIAKVVIPPLMILYALTGIAPSVMSELPSQGALAEYALCDYLLRKHGIALELRNRRFRTGELKNGVGIYRDGSKNYAAFDKETKFENVAVFDFNMLYPTIYYMDKVDAIKMRLCDNGFLVYLRDAEEKIHPYRVCTEPGPVYEWLSWFYNARAVTKKMKKALGIEVPDQAVKIVANAAFGMFSKARGNGLNELVSAYIFFRGNQLLNIALGYVETVLGKKVVYGDTDSLFVVLGENEDPKTIEEALNSFLSRVFAPELSVKFEHMFRRIVFLGKKNYVGITTDGKVVVKGIVRFEASYIIKERLEEILARVINGENPDRVVNEVIGSAKTYELFARATKRLTELYDEEEGRFVRPTHASVKAVIARYLIETGAAKNGSAVFEFYPDLLPEYPVSALYLKDGERIYILLEETPRGARCWIGKVEATEVSREVLRGRIVGSFAEIDRKRMEELAKRTSETIIDLLKRIYKVVSQSSLDSFMR